MANCVIHKQKKTLNLNHMSKNFTISINIITEMHKKQFNKQNQANLSTFKD